MLTKLNLTLNLPVFSLQGWIFPAWPSIILYIYTIAQEAEEDSSNHVLAFKPKTDIVYCRPFSYGTLLLPLDTSK